MLESAQFVGSKKTFLAAAQCLRRLWWEKHEPSAPEMRETPVVRFRIEQGAAVGVAARGYVPGGRLIQRGGRSIEAILGETQRALTDPSVPAIYEAGFIADETLVFCDILERVAGGFALIEVKAKGSLSEALHVPDAAVQLHVLRRNGIPVVRVEVMHLNRECRYPDLTNLFVREDVTELVEERLTTVGDEIRIMLDTIAAATPPVVAIGDHCAKPIECPFTDRCWPTLPEHHVTTLYRISKKQRTEYAASGWELIGDLPDSVKLSAIAARQRRAVRNGAVVVEHAELVGALHLLVAPVAHIDFETVQLAIPLWAGARPFDQIPVQLSCHVVDVAGNVQHHEWLAEDDSDPRPDIARALLDACRGAATVTAYYAQFEQAAIRLLADACPEMGDALRALADRIVDLLPIVRDHVYHPEFRGSFSLKKVLPALVPALSYEGMQIAEGETASVEIARMMFGKDVVSSERSELRRHLLAYCERDTEAMVALAERLGALAAHSDLGEGH